MTFRVQIGKVRPKTNIVALVPSASSTLAALMQESLADILVLAIDKSGEPRICASFTDEMKALRLVETARRWLTA